MKSCPTCNRTFEDTFTFCLADGSLLNAPFDPQATQTIPEPRQTEPPPTEVLKLEETKQEIPPTVASPQPEQKSEQVINTIAAPAPAFESPQITDSPAQPVRKSSLSPSIMIGVGALLILGLIIFITSNRSGSTNENAANTNTVTANIANTATVANVSNSNQTGNMSYPQMGNMSGNMSYPETGSMSTPSPSPSSTPVINLEGTVWHLITTIDSRDYSDSTLEFKQHGRIIKHINKMDDGNWQYNVKGTLIRQGDKVIMDFPKNPYFYHSKYEGTIQGEEITGSIEFFGVQANGTFKARLIK